MADKLVSMDEFIATARRCNYPTMVIQFDGECQASMQLGLRDDIVVSPLDRAQIVALTVEYLDHHFPPAKG